MYAVKFVNTAGTFGLPGMFPSRPSAERWANLECDGTAYMIFRLDALPKPTPPANPTETP